MSLTALDFYGWLAVAVLIFYSVPAKWRVTYLLAVSCAFYLSYSVRFFLLLAASTAVVYWIGLRLGESRDGRQRTRLFLLGLLPIVGVLVLFKVLNVTTTIVAPLGLSFYTFKLVGYLIEVYRDKGQIERSAVRFAAFSTFAAQMVSGPIQRNFDFLPQLTKPRFLQCDFGYIESGLRLILGGLLLKLAVGDRLGAFIAVVDQDPRHYSWPVLATSTLSYTLYVFADFAGYTNIAIGIGRLFGIESPANFAAPFTATNIQDFWRRWHMSLTSWLRDYVFTPLWLQVDAVLTRMKMATRIALQVGLAASIVLNMTLIGIWHGLTWTFLSFGVFQGIVVAISALTSKSKSRFLKHHRRVARLDLIVGIISTFLIMSVSQIFFQAKNLQAAFLHLRLLFGFEFTGTATFQDIPADIYSPVAVCMMISFYVGFGLPGMTQIANFWNRFVPNWVTYGIGILLFSAFVNVSGGHFIYGQF
jgi:alginate O-acetyltransferase complex protein AlgI